MKKTLLALMALILTLASCRVNAPVAQQSGKEDTAFLLFISGGQYAGKEVTVTIDGSAPFTAKVVKQKKAARFGTQYAVATGARTLTVTSGGQTLYQKKLFLSTQETKQITLP